MIQFPLRYLNYEIKKNTFRLVAPISTHSRPIFKNNPTVNYRQKFLLRGVNTTKTGVI